MISHQSVPTTRGRLIIDQPATYQINTVYSTISGWFNAAGNVSFTVFGNGQSLPAQKIHRPALLRVQRLGQIRDRVPLCQGALRDCTAQRNPSENVYLEVGHHPISFLSHAHGAGVNKANRSSWNPGPIRSAAKICPDALIATARVKFQPAPDGIKSSSTTIVPFRQTKAASA